jgi:hypothetical protein
MVILRFNTVSEDDFWSTIYAVFYADPLPHSTVDPATAHKLGTLYMVLALGYHLHPNEAQTSDSTRFFRLACASLLCGTVVKSPALDSLQVLVTPRVLARERGSHFVLEPHECLYVVCGPHPRKRCQRGLGSEQVRILFFKIPVITQ